MAAAAMEAAKKAMAAAGDKENPDAQLEAYKAASKAEEIQLVMDEARKRARFMEEEIDDHLRAAKYAAQARDCIDDGCKLGSGIMKGPVIGERNRRSWQQQEVVDEQGNPGMIYAMANVADPRPVFWRVNPWGFFPDPDATSIEDCEGNFERHLMNPKQLRKLANHPGFDKDAIRRLLREGPNGSTPTYLTDLRSITGANLDDTTDRFHVWEYHGPLSMEQMQEIAELMQENEGTKGRAEGILEDLEEYDGIDPLTELEAVIWFCQGELLKFGLHFLDSGDPIYSVWNLEKDDASLFGFGIPYIMRDPAKSTAAAWRILMDNAGLSSGPQIVINKQIIEPGNGVWEMEPRKIWFRKSGAPKGEPPFEIFEVPSRIEELLAIIDASKKNIDEETSMPLIAQGEQGAEVTKTMGGMSLLMNSANVIFRRIVKNWDDDMTTPNIRRMYDFLMQFSDKEHIKGDYEVDARGTSVLLVREMQSSNLLLFLSNFSGHPILGKYLKKEGLPALRRLAQTMSLSADDVVKTDDEVASDEAKAAKQPPMPDPKILEIEAKMNDRQAEREFNYQMALVQRETKMMELAQTSNLTIEQIRAQLQKSSAELASKERIFAAEVAYEERQAKRGDDNKGSGGYVS